MMMTAQSSNYVPFWGSNGEEGRRREGGREEGRRQSDGVFIAFVKACGASEVEKDASGRGCVARERHSSALLTPIKL